jgi:PAS domain S-box-containing protein
VFIATLGVSALSALIAAAISRQHQQALRTLHDRERELQQLIEAVPVMIWSVTGGGRPSYVNKRFTDVTGATLEDITAPDGSFSLSVIHPDDKAATAEMIGRSFRTGVPYVIQYRQLRRDGSYRWTETRAEALRDDSGNVLQWYGTSVDIHDLVTAQEAVRQSERQLQQLVDAVPASIWCTTREGAPTFRNKRHSDVTGAALRNVNAPVGYSSPLATMAHPDDRAAAERVRARAFETGSTYVVRYRQIRSDGSYRWTETRAEPFRDKSG